jgi:lysophospholipase L1-like esterase
MRAITGNELGAPPALHDDSRDRVGGDPAVTSSLRSRERLRRPLVRLTAVLVPMACSLGFTSVATSTALARPMKPSWVAAWGLPVNTSDTASFRNQTIRVVLRASFGGSRARIRLSNVNGTRPLTLRDGHIGIAGPGRDVQPGTNMPLTFHGSRAVTIPIGKSVMSDPAALHVQALEHLAVSVYAQGITGQGTGDSELANYLLAPGDHAGESSGASFQAAPPSSGGTTPSGSYFVTGVDVYAPNDGLIVAFGDSITVGANASDEGWPYWLADRLAQVAAQAGPRLSIIDMGISGNQVTQDNIVAGASAEHRLQRDVLDQTGLKAVLMMEGVNDIVNFFGPSPVPGPTIESGLAQIIARVRDAGAGILLSPLTPAGDLTQPFPHGYVSTPAGVQDRHDVNTWIRHTGGAYSPLFDFEPVIEDPQFPDHLLPSYNSGDNLHPNIAGQRAMADSSLRGVLKASQDAERGSCVTCKFAHSER